MKVAVTGATGFVGRELVAQLVQNGDSLKCWYRAGSDRSSLEKHSDSIEWVEGELTDSLATKSLMTGCDAVVHAGLWRQGPSFQSNDGDIVEYARVNILGTLELIEASIAAGVTRFVFVSTCAVHDHILDDRPLDEAHPLWANSHYGAHKAAIEKFVHSYGFGQGFPICAIRPTGVYGLADPIERTKWMQLVQAISNGEDVQVSSGGKEVHVSDVAKAIQVLLKADNVAGQAYSCFDRYISEFDVATIAKRLSGSQSVILGEQKAPKHMIDSSKIKALGMEFGGERLLEATVKQILVAS